MLDRKITLHPHKKNIAYLQYRGEQQPILYYPQGIYGKALIKAYQQLDNLFTYYSKVTVILLQLHQHQYTQYDNAQLTQFLEKLKAKLKAIYGSSRICYAWAREEGNDNSNLHYHITFMINGSVCLNGYNTNLWAKEIWLGLDANNRIWHVTRGSFLLKRLGDESQIRNARMRMSYAAKKRSKLTIVKGVKKFGFSRLKAKF